MKKEYGLLLPMSSLNSAYGIGDMGKCAYEFVDYMEENGYTLWQMLPINNVDSTNSPYSSDASLSLEELYLDLEELVSKKLLTQRDLSPLKKLSKTHVEYDKLKEIKPKLIKKAYTKLTVEEKNELEAFAISNPYIYEYGLFKALIEKYGTSAWRDWPEEVKLRKKEVIENLKVVEKDNILRYVFGQKLFIEQFGRLREYANKKGVKLLGDIGIYLDKNSMDVWLNPELFKLDENLNPYVVGGCPGQNWGTCIYNWEFKHFECYGWWYKRILENLKNFDYLRLDHYAGFGVHYEIPVGWGEPYWYPACNEDFFQILFSMIDKNQLIIEDIGTVSQELQDIKKKYMLKGMVLMQWAFDGNKENFALPKNVPAKNIYYIGTHDNDTLIGYLNSMNENEKKNVLEHYNLCDDIDNKELAVMMIKEALVANAETVVLTIQDLLLQDQNFRMNIPGMASGQWEYRMPDDYKENSLKLADLIK